MSRSPLVRRTCKKRSASEASEADPCPRNPAATWVSNSFDGKTPQARERTSRSWVAAWATMTRGPGQHVGQWPRVNGQGVDQGDTLAAFGTALPGHLDQCQARPIGPFPMELGVQGVRRRLFEPRQ